MVVAAAAECKLFYFPAREEGACNDVENIQMNKLFISGSFLRASFYMGFPSFPFFPLLYFIMPLLGLIVHRQRSTWGKHVGIC